MVEPVSLSLGAIVAALVAKASERAADETVDAGASSLRALVSRIRALFTAAPDEPVRAALARVEDAPDSPSRQRDLTEVIDVRARDDSGLRAELEGLVAQARDVGVDVGSISQSARGSQNVQVAGTSGSQLHVNYGSPPRGGSER